MNCRHIHTSLCKKKKVDKLKKILNELVFVLQLFCVRSFYPLSKFFTRLGEATILLHDLMPLKMNGYSKNNLITAEEQNIIRN